MAIVWSGLIEAINHTPQAFPYGQHSQQQQHTVYNLTIPPIAQVHLVLLMHSSVMTVWDFNAYRFL